MGVSSIAFFRRALPPSNLVKIGVKSTIRKILVALSQKWISQIVQKEDPFGRQGVESLREEEGFRHAPPP